jgi:peptidoglycan hydrolase-like protein with peptidoglycan-binding domain
MALPSAPPRESVYSTRVGDDGWPVYALQSGLNDTQQGLPTLVEDGSFGPATNDVVKKFQSSVGLIIDGAAGPQSQIRIVEFLDSRVHKELPHVPGGLMRGFAEGEGGNNLAAVNWSVAGGVDCGIVQYRVLGPPYDMSKLKSAFSPYDAIVSAAKNWQVQADRFYTYTYVSTRRDRTEYAKRLAVLSHNWPYGASRLAQGFSLSDRTADWVPKGLRFPDGHPVNTYSDWAQYYAMGSTAHSWKGFIPRFVTDWLD